MITTDEWHSCYDKRWKGIIVDAAMSHPAKYARGLITRIIAHALADGMIQPGGVVLDPFAGQGGGALPCLQAGLHYVGIELESKFVELARENIALWNARYAAHFPNWGSAQVLQGDSRRLAEVVGAAGLVVSSPPYANSLNSESNGIDWSKTKKDYPGRVMHEDRIANMEKHHNERRYGAGTGTGQLGALPEGEISAVISSPPFAGNSGGRGEASRNGIDAALFDRHSGGMIGGMGDEPGNLGNLPMGQAPAVVISSPPYVDSMEKSGGIDPAKSNHIGGPHSQMNRSDTRYGTAPGQLGATQGDTFWAAAKTILTQCYEILPSNACAIWVVKNYVKDGRIVQFSEQWQALCEACGFETVHIHRAMLVKRRGAQAGFDGEMVSKDVSRKSFFRRLAERKGSPPIDFETVLCMRKRAA